MAIKCNICPFCYTQLMKVQNIKSWMNPVSYYGCVYIFIKCLYEFIVSQTNFKVNVSSFNGLIFWSHA